jgi:5'-3' exonuclease
MTATAMSPLLLIDHSYYVFYKYYSISRWYSFHEGKEPDHATIMDDKVFMEKYDLMYVKTIQELMKKHKVSGSNVILAVDCERAHIWRNKVQDTYSYKGGREEPKKFNGLIFQHTHDVLFERVKKELGVRTIMVDRAEADDIIGVITHWVRKNTDDQDRDIVIIANDKDYLQLYHDKTSIINLAKKDLKESSTFRNGFKEMIYKVIVGDKSDNIPPIAKGLGPKRAKALVEDEGKLKELLESNSDIKKKFDENRLMIDLTLVPIDIQNKITRAYVDGDH